jgi:hypothetical protein
MAVDCLSPHGGRMPLNGAERVSRKLSVFRSAVPCSVVQTPSFTLRPENGGSIP